MAQVERIAAFCTQCRSRCGCTAVVEDGRLSGIEPLPDHPTGDKLCPKGRAAPELVYHKDRLTTPLRRTNPKGAADPGWQPIDWNTALDEIATRLGTIARTHGPEQVAFSATTPSGSHIQDSIAWIERLVRCLRQPEHHLRHRDLQLAQGLRRALHLRHRYRHAGFRHDGLRAAMGQQSRRHLARPRHRGAERRQARRAHDRGRSAPHGLCQARRPMAAGAIPARTRRSRSASRIC